MFPSGELPRVLIQYQYRFDDQHDLKFLAFAGCLGHVLGIVDRCDNYFRDLQRVRDVLTARGICWEDIPPTSVQFDLVPDSTVTTPENTSRHLLRVVEAIQWMQRMQEEARNNGDGVGDLFQVVSLKVAFNYTKLHEVVLEALASLVRVGVPIAKLHLPTLHDTLPSIARWGAFVRLITGLDPNDKGRFTKVRRLEMSIAYATSFYFGAFCSALSCSKSLDDFELSSAGQINSNDLLMRNRDDPFGWNEEIRCHVWRWLTFALFSKASTTSVKTVFLSGAHPKEAEIETIRKVTESTDPLKLILQASSPNQELGSVAQLNGYQSRYKLRPHSIFKASDGISINECQHQRELVGESIALDPEGDLVVFVPGYGLCRGQVSEMPQKRARTLPSSTQPKTKPQLKSLVIYSSPSASNVPDMLVSFLKIVGRQLDGLRFAADVDDNALGQILQLCPILESLAVDEATLSSMDTFYRAYAEGSKLTSLKFGDKVKIPAPALQDFMRRLAVEYDTKGTAANTLERLDCEFDKSDELTNETLTLIEGVLQKNTVLTHVNGYYHEPAPVPYQFEKYNGERIGLRKMQKNQLVALLGGLRSVTAKNAHLHFDEPIKQRIWNFVASRKHRIVDWYAWDSE